MTSSVAAMPTAEIGPRARLELSPDSSRHSRLRMTVPADAAIAGAAPRQAAFIASAGRRCRCSSSR